MFVQPAPAGLPSQDNSGMEDVPLVEVRDQRLQTSSSTGQLSQHPTYGHLPTESETQENNVNLISSRDTCFGDFKKEQKYYRIAQSILIVIALAIAPKLVVYFPIIEMSIQYG
jgi:hypothetical protein